MIAEVFDLIQIARRRVVGVDAQAPWPAAVGRTRFVVGGRRSFFEIVGDGSHLKRRFGQVTKERGQLGLHGHQIPAGSLEQSVG